MMFPLHVQQGLLLLGLRLTLLLGSVLSLPAWALTASVDRVTLYSGESIELTLETDDNSFSQPDWEPLKHDFIILGTRQVKRLSSDNQSTSTSTQWLVSLQARNTGKLTIPPLRLGNHSSQAIQIEVLDASQRPEPEANRVAPVFIDAQLSQESVYLQAQTILTLRIFHSVSLFNDSSLSPLEMEQARVEMLGQPRTYETTINGIRHGVIEVRYALFPLESGKLTIPAQAFTATMVDREQQSFLGFGSRPGKRVQVRSPKIPLSVLPKPENYPQGEPWLPAASLSLSQQWSHGDSSLPLGESLTRNLQIKADGVSATQLPSLRSPEVDGVRRYADQPQSSQALNDDGLQATRQESEALVPLQAGDYSLPAVKVTWWNTRLDRLEVSELPGRTLQVKAPQGVTPQVTPSLPTSRQPAVLLWPWQLASGLLLLSTLIFAALWLHGRKLNQSVKVVASGPSTRTLLDELKRTCQSNDPQQSRQALDAWARSKTETLAQMAARHEPLAQALDALNNALYSESGQHWQGQNLYEAVRSLPSAEKPLDNSDSALPPLYPRAS
ncbi:BatD family protein [Atopomonas sediminilitoris]|uniref:BatD family protein n=1 Tax=Atopomonas sediminilitoris TaxID=2919919 RepID=UPI001F4E667D|nr:BatD family protein [Atopomonas sediminilitoris]MCJ8167850.1 BatD family protein [Atopomonas sediminilitoris]